MDDMNPTPSTPNASVRIWSSTKGRMILGGVGLTLAGIIGWRILAPSTPEDKAAMQSPAEKAYQTIVDQSKKTGQVEGQGAQATNGKGPDLPTGDPQALAKLTEVAQKQDILTDRKKVAEEKLLDQLAYQNYMRKAQGLSYDPSLVARWEEKIRAAQAAGLAAPPPPGALDKETLAELEKSRPDLIAQWKAVGGSAPNSGAQQSAPGLTPGQGATANANGIPAGIDPTTGLPKDAKGADGLFALNEDGSPDIVQGAIPIQISYTPPGASTPVTQIRWVRPGYLTGRVRSMDPRVLAEQDDAWHRSLTESSDFPADAQVNVAIPTRYDPTMQHADADSDYTFVNRYAVVLPNPNGQKTPANPPVPARSKGAK